MIEAVIPLELELGALDEVRRTADRLTRLQRVSSALARAMTPGEVGDVIVRAAREALEATGVVLVVPGEPGQLRPFRWDGYEDKTILSFDPFPADSGMPAAVAMRTGQPVLYEDLKSLGAKHRVESRSLAVFPVISQGRSLAALGFGFGAERRFTPGDCDFMAALSDLCGQAYQRALLFDAEQRARVAAEAAQQRATNLQAVTAALSRATTPVEVAQVAISNAMVAIGASGGSVAFLAEDGKTLELVGYTGISLPDVVQAWQHIPLETAAPISDCARSGETIWLENRAAGAARYPHLVPLWDRLNVDAFGSLPLEADGRRVGAIAFVFAGPRSLTSDETGFLRAVGRHITLAFERARLYAEAERSRAFLEAAIRHVPSGMAIVDAQGRELFQNDEARRLFGSGAAARGVDDYRAFKARGPSGREYEPTEWPLSRALLQGETVQGEEATLVTPEGRSRVVQMSAAPVPGANGITAGAVVSMSDVTDLRRAQETQRFLAEASVLLSGSLDAAEIMDRLAALVVPRLADWCSVHRRGKDGSLDLVTMRHQDPELTARARELARTLPPARAGTSLEAVANGGAPVLIAEITDAHLQQAARNEAHLAQLRAQGHRSAMVVPMCGRESVLGSITFSNAESGRLFAARDLELATDLAARAALAIENALLYQQAAGTSRNLAAVIAASPLAMSLSDLDGTVRAWNPAAERLYGFSAGELVGRKLSDVFSDTVDDFAKNLARIGAGEVFEAVEGTRYRKDGQPFLGRIWATPVPTGSGVQCLFIVADITAEKQAEEERKLLLAHAEKARAEAEAAIRLKDDFLATLSHELRTPLTAILGWVRLIKLKKQEPDDIARGLDTVERNARAQLQMVEDLLDVSRIIAGKLRVALDDGDLCAVVKAALEALRPMALAKDVTLAEVGLEAPLYLPCDAGRLQQVAGNLLVNAIKFTPAGGRVEVSIAEAGEAVRLSVKDDGRGIEAAFLPLVFDRFRQAETGLTRNESGLGLGLAITRHLVELHGGSIEAYSEGPGKGARFEVLLPRRVSTNAPRQSPPPPSSAESAEGIRVLVVEDDADARELLGMMLKQFGAHVRMASSAAEGFALLEKVQFDVLLSDVSMPIEDGYSFLRRVRLSSKQFAIPAGALTANARHEDRARALEAGFQLHVPKPIEPIELVRIVGTLARGRPS